MSVVLIDDRQLYTSYSYYRLHFNWKAGEGDSQPLIYHCYWTGILTKLHELSLKSLLITQSPPYEVWVWMPPEDICRNQGFISSIEKVPSVRVISYIPENEAKDTALERYVTEFVKGQKPNVASDVFRLLALEKYGGVYFDLDVLFLKDLRPLCNVEFFYQWSNQPYGNHAISHFSKHSPNILALLARSVKIKSCHPAVLLRFPEIFELPEDIYVFPTFLFDPVWIAHDTGTPINAYCNTFDDFFANDIPMTLAEFFPDSYAYHWHNRWNRPVRRGAIVGRLYDDVCRRFEAKFQS